MNVLLLRRKSFIRSMLGGSCFVLKLDFHKAYDYVSWEYIDAVCRRMSFDQKWINWLANCRTNSVTSILVNGLPSKPIQLKRGVKQGDPIFQYIFVLAIEGLKQLINTGVREGILPGFRVDESMMNISLLQFADDTMCFLPIFIRFYAFELI